MKFFEPLREEFLAADERFYADTDGGCLDETDMNALTARSVYVISAWIKHLNSEIAVSGDPNNIFDKFEDDDLVELNSAFRHISEFIDVSTPILRSAILNRALKEIARLLKREV